MAADELTAEETSEPTPTLPAVEESEEELSPLDLPPSEPDPEESLRIQLAEIEELENSRPAYYGIEQLMNNLHTQGQLEPCLVRPSQDKSHGKPYELVYGYRRKRAAEELGWTTLRCEVREVPTDAEFLERQISENYQRENMSPIAEANAMRRMMKIGDLSQSEVARRLGVDRSQVSHRLKLLSLREEVLTKVDEGKISVSTAETIASLSDPEAQSQIAKLAERNDWGLKKVQKWVREKKAGQSRDSQELEAEAAQELVQRSPHLMVQMEDVVDLPHLTPRDDLDPSEVKKLVLYQQLRMGNDNEMIDYLEQDLGYPFDRIWDYIIQLSDEQVEELSTRMALRFLSAAHRYRTFEPALKELCQPSEEEGWED